MGRDGQSIRTGLRALQISDLACRPFHIGGELLSDLLPRSDVRDPTRRGAVQPELNLARGSALSVHPPRIPHGFLQNGFGPKAWPFGRGVARDPPKAMAHDTIC